MNCPACSHSMQERTLGDVHVDVCDGGCGGLWFDKHELERFDEEHESAGVELLAVSRDPAVVVDPATRYPCPRCESIVMQRNFFSVKMSVQVDSCAGCGGHFLDAGELADIRSLFVTTEEREAAAQEFWNSVADVRLSESESARTESEEHSRRLASLFRFLSPSYWLPGKQTWGSH